MDLSNVSTSMFPSDTQPEGDYRNLHARKWLSAWLGSIAVLAFLGNSLVVVAVVIYPRLRTTTNVFITSLAVSDILVALTIPWIIVGLVSTQGWPLPEETCILVAVLRFTCSGSSVWHLVAIGFNRMILITTSSATYRKIYSPVKTTVYVFITWLIPFSVIIVPYAVGATRLGYDDGPHLCSDLEDNPDGSENQTHAYLTGTFLTCIPLAIVLCVYLRIYIHVRLHVRKQNVWSTGQQTTTATGIVNSTTRQQNTAGIGVSSTAEQRNTAVTTDGRNVQNEEVANKQDSSGRGGSIDNTVQSQSNPACQQNTRNPTVVIRKPTVKKGSDLETRITKNTFYVVLGFLLCVFPYGTTILVGNFGPKGTPASLGFLLFNSCMNPVIYGTKHPLFRAAIRNIFTGRISSPLDASINKVAPYRETAGNTSG